MECDYLWRGHPTAECRPGHEWLFRGFYTLATSINCVHDKAKETVTDCGGECLVCSTVVATGKDFYEALQNYGATAHTSTNSQLSTQAYVYKNVMAGFLNAELGTLPCAKVNGVIDPGFFRMKELEASRRVLLMVMHPGAGVERMKLPAFKPSDSTKIVGH